MGSSYLYVLYNNCMHVEVFIEHLKLIGKYLTSAEVNNCIIYNPVLLMGIPGTWLMYFGLDLAFHCDTACNSIAIQFKKKQIRDKYRVSIELFKSMIWILLDQTLPVLLFNLPRHKYLHSLAA